MTDLFSPFTLYDGLCTISILIGSIIAAGGGLGGGGVFVPIYILILSFSTKNAAALSQATIFGGSIINLLMNWTQTHPKRKHRPLIDFKILLIFEPMLLIGTVIGVLLNIIFPNILILILLIVTLGYATIRTTIKGNKMWNSESLNSQSRGERGSGYITGGGNINNPNQNNFLFKDGNSSIAPSEKGYDTSTTEDLIRRNSNEFYSDDIPLTNIDDHIVYNSELETLNKHPKHSSLSQSQDSAYGSINTNDLDDDNNSKYEYTEWNKMAIACGVDITTLDFKKINYLNKYIDIESEKYKPMFIIFVIWVLLSISSISKSSNISGITTCSILYWFLTFILFPIMILISFYFTYNEYNIYNDKVNSGGWLPAIGDIEWNKSLFNIFKYPLIAIIAGILGGLLGIGGGMIVSPLLIELGILPTVSAATSAMTVLITSSSATLQFILLGYLQYDYCLYFMSVAIIGTFIGQTVVNFVIKQYGRKSLIIYSVAAIMGAAVILMGIDGILQLTNGITWDFISPCNT